MKAIAQIIREPAAVRVSSAARRTESIGGLPAAAAGLEISAVFLEDGRGLLEYAAQWDDLAANAIEPNVFYEPWMLIPAIEPYSVGRKIAFVLIVGTDRSRPHSDAVLCGMFPLEISNRYKGLDKNIPIRTLSLWKHKYCYMCTPLLRRGYAEEALSAFFDWLASFDHGCALMEFRAVPGEGPFHNLLVDQFNQRGSLSFISESFTRAFFRPASDADEYLKASIGGPSRKEFRRQQNRLGERGNLEFASLEYGGDVNAWIDELLQLEAISWKGQEGRALISRPEDRAYFEEIAVQAFRRGKLMMSALRLDGRAVAHKCNFLSKPGSFAFKIAYDDEFARYSPGVLLELENIRRLHLMPDIEWMNSCANPRNAMINRLWSDRLVIRDVVIGTSRAPGDFVLSAMPMLKWLNRALFRRKIDSKIPDARHAVVHKVTSI